MPGTPNKFSRFWQELKRRKTDRVLIIYAATAFTILQVSDPIRSGLSLPEWTGTFILIVLAIGFPVAAIFSWFFDITAEGIEKTKPAGERKTYTTEAELRRWKSTTLISFIIIIALILYNIISGTLGVEAAGKAEKSIAVQPIKCLIDEEDLLMKGVIITDNINVTLTNIENITLRVWPPNLNYQESKISYPEIAKKLNVAFILQGTLSKFTNRIILIVQLIKARSESIMWAKNYELDPSGNDFFEIQSDIAVNISSKLNAGLSGREKNRIKKRPSRNPAALRSYLEGSAVSQHVIFNIASGTRIFEDLVSSELYEKAIISFDEAIKNDPSFALAYAKRAIIRSWAYYAYAEHDDKTAVEKCKADIDKALQLDKDLVETKIALGFYYYYCTFEYKKALESFSQANSQQPNNWQCLFYMALVNRALGDWHKSQKLLAKVLKFSPQDPLVITNIGMSEAMLHNYDAAISYHEKAIEIRPTWAASYGNKIDAIILRDGKTAEARKVLDTAALKTGDNMRSRRILFDIYDGKYIDALHQIELSEPYDFDNDRGEQIYTYGDIYRYLNDNNTAVTFYKSAIVFYKQVLTKEPDNCRYLGALGLAYAALNNKTEAVESGKKAVDLASNNAMRLAKRKLDLAKIYARLGEYDKCLEQLEYLLKNPSDFSGKLLRLDPIWKPLYENPEFKKLTKNY